MPMTKEERKIYNRQYREKHKEKLAIYDKEYGEKHKEKKKQQHKEWVEKNKEYVLQQSREWRELNKDKISQQSREYRQTDAGKKSHRIASWKRQGMLLPEGETWDSIYRKYLDCTNCEQCNKVFQTTRDKHMDHCHTTRFIRNIICCRCNTLRGYEDAKNLILE